MLLPKFLSRKISPEKSLDFLSRKSVLRPASELGHPLIDDNHYRPLHPRVGPFLREYLSRYEDMDDVDDEINEDNNFSEYLAPNLFELIN